MSQQVKGRLFFLIALIAFSVCALLPTYFKFAKPGEDVLPKAFTDFFKNELVLGLDLRGGIHIQYEVDTKEALRNKARNFAARLRTELPSAEGMPEALKDRRVVARSHINGADAEEVTKIDLSFPVGDDDGELDPALPWLSELNPKLLGQVVVGPA